ncbi:MAG: hypothetical protein OXI77_17160 [Chloroflexota bacterium]|nr:hypothetical protein [Chloroflexota bacterium]MDE2911001.1 hypothetical protein [Chloroflexota bacterium]
MFKDRSRSLSRACFTIILGALIIAANLAPVSASVCTLADHIRAANTNTAVGFCPAGTSHDIITIGEDITLTEPLPPITGTITIEGGGHTISGDGKYPIFNVDGGNLTINNLTLTKGNGVDYLPGLGGSAISADRSTLTVNNSSFVGNTGSAIVLWRSTSEINSSSFLVNRKQYGYGGAIYVGQGVTLDVNNSTFSANHAASGGSALATNVSTMRGIIPSRVTLTHVTIVASRVAGKGLGFNIWIDENDRNFKLRNSLIIGEKSPYRKETSSCQGPLSENSGNFIEDGSCASMAGGDPMLGEMTGSPAYFPLLDGSPALDAADARYCTETDQLGRPRPIGAGCDIGAIESTTAMPVPTPVPGVCPLPDQIIAANTDRAVGSCPAGNGADTIRMIRDFTLEKKLPPITSDITIDGNGYTISGDKQFGLFEVDGGSLTIINVTLKEGNASRGGAIQLKNGGFASVADVTFRENSAFYGGAIATESDGDRLTVRKSSFIGNTAETSGGAILIDGGVTDVSESAFHGNTAAATGGAIATLRGRAAISNSTISGSTAVNGGGIYSIDGESTLTHLTIMNNHAEHIFGAGVYAEGGAVSLRNSIVAGSGSGDDCSGRFAQSRGNFSEDGSCAEEPGGDPLLANLVETPSPHYPLLDSSPAHGAADAAFCLDADQLGNARTHCDIGAIESARDPNYVDLPVPGLSEDCTLADQIIAANTDEPAGACPAGDGADVIRLRQDITLKAPLPSINSDIAFDGRGHTISGDNRYPIFDIESGNVVFKRITLADGRNLGERPDGYGGAITLRNSADLVVFDTTFRNNRARMGGAVASIDASHLYIFESRFLDNEASSKGGALWRNGACGFIYDIEFRRNIAGELPGTVNDDYFTHMDGGASTCTSDPEVYSLSDS